MLTKEFLEDLMIHKGLSMNKIAIQENISLTKVRFWAKKYGLSSLHKTFSKSDTPHLCKDCGDSDPSNFEKGRKSVCISCRKKWASKHNTEKARSSKSYKKQRDNKKLALIDYKGGKCQVCGYNRCKKALSFHHLNPLDKSFSIAHHIYLNIDILKKEVDKCVLLCSNCHAEVHDGIVELVSRECR